MYLNLQCIKISIFKLVSVIEQTGLGKTSSETPKTAFLVTRLIHTLACSVSVAI